MHNVNLKRSFVSLQGRITILIAGLMVAMVSVLFAVTSWSIFHEAKTAMKQQSALTSSLLAENIAGAVRFGKTDNVQTVLQRLFDNAGGQLESVITLDKQGSVFIAISQNPEIAAAEKEGQNAMTTESGVFSSEAMLHATPLVFGKKNEIVGAVVLAWSHDFLMGTVWDELLIAIGFVLPIGLVGLLA
ncbi:MAG: hypothetical protein AB8B85_10250, partial [Paracoccaceae bacterium]